MIPKKIHYCWFGGNPLTEIAKKCIDSWKKFFPDYEIIEWNEQNFDVYCNDYVKEAYENKKWAFVSDYARFKILYEEGGLYFDTDVEVVKDMSKIIEQGSFMGAESLTTVNPGLGIGASKGLEFYKIVLEDYEKSHFKNEDGTINLTTIVERTTKFLEKYGLKEINKIENFKEITIYPKEYFCPINYETNELTLTDETYSIHHYTASWYDETQKCALKLKRKFNRFLPKRIADISAMFFAKLKCEGFRSCLKWVFKKRK